MAQQAHLGQQPAGDGEPVGGVAGKIDLIYIDPPFATGADFSFKAQIGGGDLTIEKRQSAIEEKAYRDTWGRGVTSFFTMIDSCLRLMGELLSPTGTIFVQLHTRMASSVRHILNEIFGERGFLNEIIWHYKRWPTAAREYQQMHDVIIGYTLEKGKHVFNKQYGERTGSTEKRWKGQRIVATHDEDGNRVPSDYAREESQGASLDDVWNIPIMAPVANERTGYATQEPEASLERIISGSSNEGGLVADLFCGSGTTCAVAEKLNRRWIGCDLGRFVIHTTRKRLLDIPDRKPFEILNLGQYERKYWQGMTFDGEKPATPDAAAVAAYVQFILEPYRALPLPSVHIHGRKGGALVHVGAVDTPVTISEINAALAETAELGQKELHILGWEWEMGMHDPLVQQAKQSHGPDLRLLNIPREVMERKAVNRGDVRFFDLALLSAELVPAEGGKRRVKVRLADFVMPDTDLIPEEVRAKIRKWSDYINYWAVDFDFQHDTFMNQWQAYRTRKNRKLDLQSAGARGAPDDVSDSAAWTKLTEEFR
jgi:adenine-specific DNA-methyltransferase